MAGLRRTLTDLAAIVAEGFLSLILADSFGIDEPAAAPPEPPSPAPARRRHHHGNPFGKPPV